MLLTTTARSALERAVRVLCASTAQASRHTQRHVCAIAVSAPVELYRTEFDFATNSRVGSVRASSWPGSSKDAELVEPTCPFDGVRSTRIGPYEARRARILFAPGLPPQLSRRI